MPEPSLYNFNPSHYAQAKALLQKQNNLFSNAVFADIKPINVGSDTVQVPEIWDSEIHLNQVVQAFNNSSKAYLTQLGIYLQSHDYLDIDTENFQTDGLDYFKLLQISLKHKLLDTSQSKSDEYS